MANADILIIGGGCAGLSLAMRLAELGDQAPRTLVLEARTQYTNDRTWCFWENDAASMAFTASLIVRRWARFRIRAGSSQVIADCAATPYALLPSLVFYKHALSVISRSERVKLFTGMPVSAISQLEDSLWSIEVDGKQYMGKMVIDTRPAAKPGRHPSMLWQSFSGVEIESKTAIFDPMLVDLMDFRGADPTRVIFTYALPTAPNRALIEATVFAESPISHADLIPDLQRAILLHVGRAPYKILGSEHGILPMGQPRQTQSPPGSYITVGLGSGAARASTGYAFQRIQLWAMACAQQLGEGEKPLRHTRDSWRLRTMDDLFLRVIRTHPASAPRLFLSLFEKANTASVIRFLSDGGTLSDSLAVIRALPPLPFLQASFASIQDTIFATIAAVVAIFRRQKAY